MRRGAPPLTVLTVLGLVLCFAASPAAAADLPASVQGVVTGASATVQQVSTATVSTVTAPVETAVQQPTTEAPSTPEPVAATVTHTVSTTRDVAEPKIRSAVPSVPAKPASAPDAPRAAASAAQPRDRGPGHEGAHARRAGILHPAAAASNEAERSSRRGAPAAGIGADPVAAQASRQLAAATPVARSDSGPSSPDRGTSAAGGSPASAAGSGFFFGGRAALAVLLCLAGPALRRRLLLPPAVCRQAAFVALLERPG
jgi:hypothetical protein